MMLLRNRFPHAGYKDENGLSLVSTLWILTILSVLAAQVLYSLHIEQRTQRNFLDRAKFHYAAKAGFEWALAVLRSDETPFDSLGETWAEPIEGQLEDGVQGGNILNYQVTISDEASKVDINSVDAELLSNLLAQTAAGAAAEEMQIANLANSIIEGRPYRTVRDLARVEGMTPDILYGVEATAGTPQAPAAATPQTTSTPMGTEAGTSQPTTTAARPGLVDMATIHSVDLSTDPDGESLVNLNTADAQQLTQINTQQNQSVFSQAEAEALIQQREFDNFASLMDIRAVSDNLFNTVQNQITTEDAGREADAWEDDDENRQININTADVETLQELQGVDQGIAERIVEHRDTQGIFQNIDALKEVKLLTQQEFIGIVDRITLTDGDTRSGLINVNTASPEVLALLPGMDAQKASAIVARREQDPPNDSELQNFEPPIKGNPLTRVSQLSELEEIDFETFRQIANWVTYRSASYRIDARGVGADGRVISSCVGIIDSTGDQVVLQYWKQD